MATTAKLQVVVAGDAAGLNRAMRQAAKSVSGLQKSVGSAVGKINGLIGTLGIGLTTSGLTSMAKAAAEDAKSLAVMSNALRNSTKATDEQVAAADRFVQSLSAQFGITDDDLRPALQKLALATGDLTQAQALLPIAANLAASANVDLATASNVLAKAHNGNMTSLYKLMPALKGVNDPMGELQKLTAGAAEAAANANPWQRLTVIFGNLMETIGNYLLPYLSRLSEWLATEEGQAKLQMLANGFGAIFTNIGNLVGFLSDNRWIVMTVSSLFVLVKVWRTVYTAVKAVYTATKAAAIADFITNSLKAGKSWASIISGVAGAAAAIGFFATVDAMIDPIPDMGEAPSLQQRKVVPNAPTTYQNQNIGAGSGVRKATQKTDEALKAAIATVQARLVQIRKLIADWGVKFQESVSLSFGIVERGAAKLFKADRFVKELKRMKTALADYQSNLQKLRNLGGTASNSLLNQILGMSPEEGAAIMREFVNSPALFQEAVATSNALGATGLAVGTNLSQMVGNQTETQMLAEIKLLRADLAKGKNTYNINATMTAQQILTAIRSWEKSTGKRVLAG